MSSVSKEEVVRIDKSARFVPAAFLLGQVLIMVFAVGVYFHVRQEKPEWLLLALALPCSRFALSSSFRRDLLARVGHWWQAIEAPSASWGLRWRATACFVVLPAAVLFFSTRKTSGSGDTWPVIPAAFNLLRHGNVELSEYKKQAPEGYFEPETGLPYCLMETENGIYSGYPSGMVVFAVPVVEIARFLGVDLESGVIHERLEKFTAAWLAAASLGLFFLIALRLVGPGPGWLATFFLAVGSAMFSTVSQGLWQHGGVLFWALLVLFLEFEVAGHPTWSAVCQGFALAMMVPCRLSSALFAVCFAVWVFFRSPRRAVLITVSSGVAFLPWAAYHLHTYGNPFGPSTDDLSAGNWNVDLSEALLGVLISPARGLFVYQPWLLLGVLCAVPAVRRLAEKEGRPAPTGWPAFCLAVVVLHIGLVSAWGCWWGGSCWGSRLLAEIVPLAALLCLAPIAVLMRFSWGKMLLAGLAASAFLVHSAATYHDVDWEGGVDLDNRPEMLWSWSHAPFLMAFDKNR